MAKHKELQKYIKIRKAAEHNLKEIDLDVPRDEFVVFTGLSGSGKSSLAFDTIYAEGQRRYMESLSSYARQFLGQMEKPNVDSIEGLPPAISIDQKSTNRNPRSTVGTVTEIYDYYRLLYARIGIPHCPKCGKEIYAQTVDQMADEIMELPEGTRIQLLAPVVRGRKGQHVKVFESARKSGYVRVVVDGHLYELSEEISLEKNKKHNIEVINIIFLNLLFLLIFVGFISSPNIIKIRLVLFIYLILILFKYILNCIYYYLKRRLFFVYYHFF